MYGSNAEENEMATIRSFSKFYTFLEVFLHYIDCVIKFMLRIFSSWNRFYK